MTVLILKHHSTVILLISLCRANPKMQTRIGEYNKEDVVLMLPNGLTVEKLGHFQIWCKTYKVNFGEWSMP